ncbi:MAG: hypothetical protein Q8R40_02255 [bacterium]|nr:hypothetical protein [bacterium]
MGIPCYSGLGEGRERSYAPPPDFYSGQPCLTIPSMYYEWHEGTQRINQKKLASDCAETAFLVDPLEG